MRRRAVLLVDSGPVERLLAHGRPRRLPLVRLSGLEITAPRLQALDPSCVMMALFDSRTDAFDLLECLADLHYRGRVLVLSPPLPRTGMVMRELAAAGPGLRLRLVQCKELAVTPHRPH